MQPFYKSIIKKVYKHPFLSSSQFFFREGVLIIHYGDYVINVLPNDNFYTFQFGKIVNGLVPKYLDWCNEYVTTSGKVLSLLHQITFDNPNYVLRYILNYIFPQVN